ncbi:MAG: TIGR02206 family membrane protein [Oscillochloridaceae bacterium umkhey_bin13]
MYGLYPSGEPFILFGPSHILALVAVIAISFAVALGTPRLGPRGQQWLRWSLAVFCLSNTIAWDLWQRAHGIWSIAYSLPLHLCTLSVPLAAIMLATRNYKLYQLLYFWGFAGATQAMLTPDLQASGHDFPHFVYLIFWTSHGCIWWAVLFAGAAWGYRPTWRSIGLVFVITNLIMLLVGLVNWLTGGNYMFIARTPDYASLLDFFGPWPWYILVVQLIALVLFVLLYLPYAWRDRRRAG